MGTIKSANYNAPSCESHVGNMTADIMEYTFTGAEPVDTIVKLRKMSEHNSYLRITAIAEAGFVALTEVDIGYVSREDGQADVLDAFAAGIILTTENQSVIADVKEIALKHDIVMTIKVNAAGNAGKKVKLLVELVNVAG